MKVRINPRTDIPLHQIHKSKRDIEDRIDDEEWQQQMLELTEERSTNEVGVQD